MARSFRRLLDRAVFAERDEDIVAPFLVDERRSGFGGGEHVGDRRELFVFEAECAGDILRFGAAAAHAHRNNLADVAELIDCQDRLTGALEVFQRRRRHDRLDAGQILGGEHGAAKSFGDVDLLQPRVRDWTAHEGHVARAGEMVIADVLASPAQESFIFLAKDRGSDSVPRHAAASQYSSLNKGAVRTVA